MTEYYTIAEAKHREKGGNISTKVVLLTDVISGDGKRGPWKRQEATLLDNSGETKLTMWNDDVNSVDLGQSYKMEGLLWKMYNNELQPQIGQYTKLHTTLPEDFIPVSGGSSPAPRPTITTSIANITSLPKLEQSVENIIKCKAIELLQIEENVTTVLNKYCPHEAKNGQKIGMMTRTIFLFLHHKADTS